MGSFFSDIQSYFKEEYGGRYIGALLSEVCRVDPAPFKRFFAHQFNDRRFLTDQFALDTEYSFRASNGVRRADLVVTLNRVPAAFVELKFNDRLIARTRNKPAQLSDYLHVCRSRGLRFLLLSRDPLTRKEVAEIRAYRQHQVHFSRLATSLGRSNHAASQMLFEYFRERGLVMEKLREEFLYRFFHRLLKPWGESGRINSKDALAEGPAQFQALLANMRLIAADLATRIRPDASGGKNRSPTIDFHLAGQFGVSDLTRAIGREKNDPKVIDAPDKARRGGMVYVYALQWLDVGKGTKWLYLEYGLKFHVRPGRNRSLSPRVYALVDGQNFRRVGIGNIFSERALRFSALAKPEHKGEIEGKLLQVIRKSARAAAKLNVITSRGRRRLLRI